jgi:hypothetical protein
VETAAMRAPIFPNDVIASVELDDDEYVQPHVLGFAEHC